MGIILKSEGSLDRLFIEAVRTCSDEELTILDRETREDFLRARVEGCEWLADLWWDHHATCRVEMRERGLVSTDH
jgi:hypothetical protein